MKKVIVIGASSGIGKMLAEHYASTGCSVGIAARREENLKEIQKRYPNKMVYVTMDVTDRRAGDIFNSLVKMVGGVDLVIYCSGAGRHIDHLDVENEMGTVNVNIEGFLNIVIEAFNYFLNRKEPTGYTPQIVTISSVASIKGLGSSPAYSATKRFQTKYFESLAQFSKIKGVKIDFTAILPGFISTDFIHHRYPMTMTPAYAIKRIIRAIDRRKMNKVIDWRWGVVVVLLKMIPTSLWRKIKIS